MIDIIHANDTYHLCNDRVSYVLGILPGGVAAHLYFGARVKAVNAVNALRHAGVFDLEGYSVQECSLDRVPQEYPSFGLGDLREGALSVEGPDGTCAVDLRFVKADIADGKPALIGLPATFGENCKTLTLTLRDEHTGLEAALSYTIFEDCDAVARSAKLTNTGAAPLTVKRAMSLCLDLPEDKWELITLSGAWAREREVVRRPLAFGEQGVSTRNGASSLQTTPFMALARPGATEQTGEAMGMALVYSGNFAANVTVHQDRKSVV